MCHRILCHGICLEFLIQFLHIIGQLCPVQRLYLSQISVHHALSIKNFKCICILSPGGSYDRYIAFYCNRRGNIGYGNVVDIHHKYAPIGQGLRAVGDAYSTLIHQHIGAIRNLNYVRLEGVGIVVAFRHHQPLQHLRRVRQHGCRLGGSQGSLGQEAAIHQRKPAAIHRHLNIIRIGDIRSVGIGVCTVVKLETQAVIQRVRRKLAGRGLLRLKRRACLQINHAELHRHQQVAVS